MSQADRPTERTPPGARPLRRRSGRLPAQVGAYRIERELGRGGMGVVYLASDTRLGRRVALKALPPDLVAGREDLARFEREARLLASINHPNVATVHGLEEHDGRRILVMEYLDGEGLNERLAHGPLAIAEALATCAQVAAGLSAAHELDLVHRDLKPANVRSTARGLVKVLDFGLARPVQPLEGETVTGSDVVLGTAGYMAPEQLRGEDLDARVDVWALGCVLYECLSGCTAFPGATWPERAAAALRQDVDWAQLPEDTPDAVRALLAGCLEKDREARPHDVLEIQRVLEAAGAATQAGDAAATPTRRGAPVSRPVDAEPAAERQPARRRPVVRTVLLSALVDGSGGREDLDDPEAAVVAARHARLASGLAAAHGGVEAGGGGELAVLFENPLEAVRFALAYHEALDDLSRDLERPLRARVGVHLGTVILREAERGGGEEGDPLRVDGLAVPRARRVMGLAGAGQTLLTRAAADVARRIADGLPGLAGEIAWVAHGAWIVDGDTEPVEIVEVGREGSSPLTGPLDSAHARRHSVRGNLPSDLSTFVGRRDGVAAVVRLVGEGRVVTLVGPGGCGKTRLALTAAHALEPAFPHGAWLVDLAAVPWGGRVEESVASALGVGEEPGRSLVEAIGEHLAGRSVLLVLDNCEHVRDAACAFVSRVLPASAGTTVLATSREALGVPGETAWPVPPLAVPRPGGPWTAEELADVEAVQLFVERARAARPSFELGAENAESVARIVSWLEGMPLAIELAAARVRALAPQQIEQRLGDCFRLLSGGSRSALPRQRALRATIDWSHDQLDEAERVLFRRLTVFAGSFGLDVVEATCSDEALDTLDVMDRIADLVDKSLVQVAEEGGEARYRLLQVIREYAREKLEESGEAAALRDRHAECFLSVVEDATGAFAGAGQAGGLARLDRDLDDVRAALDARAAAADDRVLSLAARLRGYFELRGLWSEGRERLEALLEAARDTASARTRAAALTGAGTLAWRQGDHEAARRRLREGLDLARAAGDRSMEADALNNLGGVAWSTGDLESARESFGGALDICRGEGLERGVSRQLNNLGAVAWAQGDLDAARSLYEESLAMKRALSDESGVAVSLNNLANVLRALGDLDGARSLLEEGLARRRELGDRQGVAETLGNLGGVRREQGDLPAARALHAESLELYRELGDPAGVAEALEDFAVLAEDEGRPDVTARLAGAAGALRESSGSPLVEQAQRARLSAAEERARAALGDEKHAVARTEGAALGPDAAAALALADPGGR